MAIGYGDRKHKANDFRSPHAELHEFRKFNGVDEQDVERPAPIIPGNGQAQKLG